MATYNSTTVTLTLFNAQASNATGTKQFGIDQFSHVQSYTNWSVQTSSTGTPTGYTITIQFSIDGVNWVNAATTFTQADGNPVTKNITPLGSGTAAPYIRAVLTGLTGGTAPTVTVSCVGVS